MKSDLATVQHGCGKITGVMKGTATCTRGRSHLAAPTRLRTEIVRSGYHWPFLGQR